MAEIAFVGVSRLRLALSLPLLAFLGGLAATLRMGRGILEDPDIFEHIAVGRWIIAHRAVPHADFLSHTMPGAPWVAHEWLAQLITALVYDRLGWNGLVLMAGLAAGAALAALARALLRYLEPAQASLLLFGAGFVLLPHWLARPHLLALPLLVLWMAALVAAREEERAPHPAVALLMIPWVNLHASFLVGIGFAALFLGEALLSLRHWPRRRATLRGWMVFLAAALAATLVTPNGIEAWLLPFHLTGMAAAMAILVEWQSPNFAQFQPLAIWLIACSGAALLLGLRLPLTRLAMILGLLHLALAHARHGELLAFAAPLLAAPALGPQLRGRNRPGVAALDRAMAALAQPARAGGVAATLLLATAAASLAARFPVTPDPQYVPKAALAAVRAAQVGGPVLNGYTFGGYLILSGVPTYIDGRADMFGNAFLARHFRATRVLDGELPALLDQDHIAWTIFPPSSQAVVLLDLLPGWRRLYADDVAVVHVRAEGGGAAQASR